MSPCFILSKKAVVSLYKQAAQCAGQVSYSFKTNKEVGYVLRDLTDADFSIHSVRSVDLLGCPERIWFFAQGWAEDMLLELSRKGVRRFVVDNESDLDVLERFMKDKDQKIDLLLRMRLREHTIHTGKHFVFGMYSHQIEERIPKLKKIPQIGKLGIHVHRKTQNISEWSLKSELEMALPDPVLEQIDLVNIGGGIPAKYKNFGKDVQDRIFEKIHEVKAWLDERGIMMMIEPGRFIAAPSIELETTVINMYDDNIIVDCSVYQGMMDTFVSHIRLMVKGEKDGGEAYTIKGCTPDSIDILRYRVFLDCPKKGDKIVFLNAGAYTYSTDFCGLPKIPVRIVD